MKRLFSTELEGIGGWLAFFQARMYAGFIPLLVLHTGPALTVLFAAAAVLCIALFYLRRMAFRGAYIVMAALGIVVCVVALPAGLPYMIAQLVLDAAIIPALFQSRRVRETFVRCRQAADVYEGHFVRRDRNSYDVYLATYRCAR